MPAVWTILYDGVEKTPAEWGIANNNFTIARNHLNVSSVTLSFDGRAFDAAYVFAFGAIVILKRDGVRWFFGQVEELDGDGRAAREGQTLRLVDPFIHFQERQFQVNWKYLANPVAAPTTFTDKFTSHVIIGTKVVPAFGGTFTNQKITLGEQIIEAINYLAANGAPIQPHTTGDVDLPVNLLSLEERDVTCESVLQRMLKLQPDAVCFFDYSTEPYPTLKVRTVAQMTSKTLYLATRTDIPTGQPAVTMVSPMKPRYDLQRPAVVLNYESSNTDGDRSWMSYDVDKYPIDATGREFRCLTQTMTLFGLDYQTQRVAFTTAAINVTSKSWWEDRYPYLKDHTNFPWQLVGAATRLTALPYMLTGGQIPDWIGATTAEEEIKTAATFGDDGAGSALLTITPEVLVWKGVATNRAGGTFERVTRDAAAETKPIGLALALWTSLNRLQWQGVIELTEAECSGWVTLGMKINILGGNTAWETMDAVVTSIEEDLATGTTKVSFGPVIWLGPQDLLDLSRANRNRFVWTSLDAPATGGVGSGSSVVSNGKTNYESATKGSQNAKKITVRLTGTTGMTGWFKQITLDPSLLANGEELTVLELPICIGVVTKHVKVIGLGPY